MTVRSGFTLNVLAFRQHRGVDMSVVAVWNTSINRKFVTFGVKIYITARLGGFEVEQSYPHSKVYICER